MQSEIYERMLLGKKVARPNFKGYWYWDSNKNTIMIYNEDGTEIDIRDTQDVKLTYDNFVKNDWEVIFPSVTTDVYITFRVAERRSCYPHVDIYFNGSVIRKETTTRLEIVQTIKEIYQSNNVKIYIDYIFSGFEIDRELKKLNIPFTRLDY